MKFFGLKSFYIVTDIKEHQQKKSQLLKCIDAMPQDSINDGIELTSKTVWNIPSTHKREYLDIFSEMFTPYMDEMASKLRCETWDIYNTWYQVYNRPGDKHGWHTHMYANYTNVYYLSLPNRSIKTQLYDVMSNRIIKDVKVNKVFCAPGNAGIEVAAAQTVGKTGHLRCVPVDIADSAALLDVAAKESVDLTVVGPELPLSKGVADRFYDAGRPLFGPLQAAARLESSKVFAKEFMAR